MSVQGMVYIPRHKEQCRIRTPARALCCLPGTYTRETTVVSIEYSDVGTWRRFLTLRPPSLGLSPSPKQSHATQNTKPVG